MIRNSLIMVRCSTPALLQLPFPRGRGHRDHGDGRWGEDEGGRREAAVRIRKSNPRSARKASASRLS